MCVHTRHSGWGRISWHRCVTTRPKGQAVTRPPSWARMKEPFLHVCRGASPDWVASFQVKYRRHCYREVSPLHHTTSCFDSTRSQRGAGRVGSIHHHNNMLTHQCFANSNYHKHFFICAGYSLFAWRFWQCNVLHNPPCPDIVLSSTKPMIVHHRFVLYILFCRWYHCISMATEMISKQKEWRNQ